MYIFKHSFPSLQLTEITSDILYLLICASIKKGTTNIVGQGSEKKVQ